MQPKYIGAVIVFLSCGAFGFIKAANSRLEERLLTEIVGILERMQSELAYRLTPLPQICANAAEESSGCLKKVFSVLSAELEGQIAPDAATCMQVALTAVKELPEKVRYVLALLGNSFGKFDLQGQLNELSAVRQYCLTQLAQLRENQSIRLRSYQTLGLCIGAGLAILFL